MHVIMFCFAGRKANMELQLPYVRRILAEHPNVEYHVWNLTRNLDDDAYLRNLRGLAGDRITVHHELYGPDPWRRFNDIYRYYADQRYAGSLFVKLDDDVVFMETERFADFLIATEQNPDAVVSAKVVNNGACTPLTPALHARFTPMRIPLLDWHLHGQLATLAHYYLFDHLDDMTNQPVALQVTEDWLSINLIGYNHAMAVRIAEMLGTRSPAHIAGRNFMPRNTLGDEGLINTLPRKVLQGFTAGHLTFGPQEKQLTADELAYLRWGYADISAKYLGA